LVLLSRITHHGFTHHVSRVTFHESRFVDTVSERLQ